MKEFNIHDKVLIVGGGPVGMMLALELALFGIKSRIISKHTRSSPHSKATIIWPGVLELFERTGLSKKLIAEAHYFDHMNYYSNKKLVGNIRFDKLKDTPYPFGITIPQWKTERILEDALNAKGIFIEYGYEFIHGHDTKDHVEVAIKGPDGIETLKEYKWLIGADGFSSKVRSNFGFEFKGFPMETRLAITDTEIVSEATSSEVGYYLHKSGNMVLAPLGDGIFRVGASVPSDFNGDIDRKFFDSLLKIRVPGYKKLGKIKSCGLFNAHVRSVSTLRKGHVLLAGDSAHAMSPSGAQGLNCGFHDVVNLVWKLASVITGNYDESLLDTYSSERIYGIRYTTSLSTFLANVSLYKSLPAILFRDAVFWIASKTGLLAKYFSPIIAQLDIPIKGNKCKKSLEIGKRIPLQYTKTSLGPTICPTKFTVLLWPGKDYSFFDWNDFRTTVNKQIDVCSLVDLAGKSPGMLRGFLQDTPVCIVVRPDGYISKTFKFNHQSHDEVINKLKEFFNK